MLDLVAEKLHERGRKPKLMVLPHCAWNKFGDLLANSGGRCLGLFDEMMSFFATMNMYSSTKLQISDTHKYQDFLHRKSKSRKTGNDSNHIS